MGWLEKNLDPRVPAENEAGLNEFANPRLQAPVSHPRLSLSCCLDGSVLASGATGPDESLVLTL